jgi:hypothetical protein
MSAARVKLTPNTTAATRSAVVEMVMSWRVTFDANRWMAAIPVVNGRNETNSRSIRFRRIRSASAALTNRVRLLCAIQTPPMKAKLMK